MDDAGLMRRLGRSAAVVCVLMMVVGLAVAGIGAAAAVAGGALLTAIGVYALHNGTKALASLLTGEVAAAETRRVAWRAGAGVVGRYALLAFLAYVMIARLRLHPVGLLAGASSVAAAVGIEAARVLLNGSKRST